MNQTKTAAGHVSHSAALNHPLKHSAPQLKLSFIPNVTAFLIDERAQMPQIQVACEPTGIPPAVGPATAKLVFEWKVTLQLHPAGVPFAAGRTTTHPPIHQTQSGSTFTIPFTAVRGGTLTVSASTMIGGKLLQGSIVGEVLGTNPSLMALRSEGVSEVLLQLMTVETTTRSQFLPTGHKRGFPLFSQDGLGGVGLGQVTKPRPTDDEVWSWKSNVKAATTLFLAKKAEAKQHFVTYMAGSSFRELVKAYNDDRLRQNKAALDAAAAAQKAGKKIPPTPPKKVLLVSLPTPTDEMIENETIRRYNGEPVIPEYVPLRKDGLLVIQEAPDGLHGSAQWHQVTTEERVAAYDASPTSVSQHAYDAAGYVEKVRAVVLQ